MTFLMDLSSKNDCLIMIHVLRKSYFFKPLLDYLPNIVHVRVCDIIQISKWKNF